MRVAPHAYGPHRDQFGELTLPAGAGPDRPAPVAVLVHGGSWLAEYDLDPLRPAAVDLAERGWATWNVEYRRVGDGSGGGWPQTLEDVSAAVDHLATLAADGAPLDLGCVVSIGHSAGGHLALLDAARDPEERRVRLRAAVGVAPLTDLVRAHGQGDGESLEAFLGGAPEARADAYAAASPVARLPLGVPHLLVHGDRDDLVPPVESAAYVAAARDAGDVVALHLEPGQDHFDVVVPGTGAWAAVRAYLDATAAGPPAREG